MRTFTHFLVLFFLFITITTFGQTTLKGKVVDEKGKVLPGANVSLKGSYDGATADAEGNFQFKTSEKNEQVIIVTFVGYESNNQKVTLKLGVQELTIKMRETSNELNTVTVTAGSFEASDERSEERRVGKECLE